MSIKKRYSNNNYVDRLSAARSRIYDNIFFRTPSGVKGGRLLDLYPGAAAAYSLRLLRSDYTGACLRVRRSSDDAEQDIGFLDNGDLDEASLLSFCGAGDGFVTTWYDQSTNARDVSQATAASQPKIVSAGSVVQENLKPAVDFDGVDDWLASSLFTAIPQPTTAFVVFSKAGSSTVIHDGGTERQAVATGNNQWTTFAGLNLRNTAIDGNQHIVTSKYNSTASKQWVDGVNTITGNAGTANINGFALGATFTGAAPHVGVLQEFLFFPADEESNQSAIETNINDYWSVY